MCGIFAIFLRRPLTQDDIALGRAATLSLRHRGPDSSGEWIDEKKGVFIGHRRLSIIDPTNRSDQPLQRARDVLAYNGEMYNFRHLRTVLQDAGATFETTGDTEVVLRSLQKWGEQAHDRFDGMYALVHWNGVTASLAIDPFGEKPLFWAQLDDGVYVSSEVAVLAHHLGVAPSMTPRSWAAYLSLGCFPAPLTAYPSINKMPPAAILKVRNGRAGELRQHWRPPVGEIRRGSVSPLRDKEIADIADLLTENIETRLISDVPIALFLSAGIDSSLIAALAAKELGRSVDTITVSFPRGRVTDEAPQAERIAQHLGLPHRIIESDEDPLSCSAETLVTLFGQPTGELSAFAVHQISRAVSNDYKVALTGMGGDELVWGYGKHKFLWQRRHLYGLPSLVRKLARSVPPSVYSLSRRGRIVERLLAVDDSEIYPALKNYPAIGWLRQLSGFDAWAKDEFGSHVGPPYQSVPAYEFGTGLANEHLYTYDLASMRASVELRAPFLSRSLAEKIAEFDPRSLVAFGQKSILRRLLGRFLPDELFDHPKSGFNYPADIFLRGCGAEAPSLTDLPPDLVNTAWNHRYEEEGWARIAVRLACAAAFFEPRQSRPA